MIITVISGYVQLSIRKAHKLSALESLKRREEMDLGRNKLGWLITY